jgi:hypothetical protein
VAYNKKFLSVLSVLGGETFQPLGLAECGKGQALALRWFFHKGN